MVARKKHTDTVFKLRLYAYFRQVILSIDRIDDWKSFVNYFNSKRNPTDLVKMISHDIGSHNYKEDFNNIPHGVTSSWKNIPNRWARQLFSDTSKLKNKENNMICSVLIQFSKTLGRIDSPDNSELLELKEKFTHCAYSVLEPYLSNTMIDKAWSVEHLNQYPQNEESDGLNDSTGLPVLRSIEEIMEDCSRQNNYTESE